MRERSEHALLNELGEWHGILLEYQDIWGNRQIASDQTKRAILAAMGVCADSVDAIRRELAVCMDAPWRQPCDPVMVVRAESAAGCWSFRIPSQEREDRDIQIRWDITDEAGARLRSEEAGPGLLPTEVRLVDGFRHVRYALPLPTGLTIGYYALVVRGVSPAQRVEGTLRLIVVPPHCYVPAQLREGHRTWGLAIHLYALRSSKNWGVGDFGDLAEFVDWAAKDLRAGIIGVNPLHHLKNAQPFEISPYSPDSRLYLNVLYLDVERIPEFRTSPSAQRMVEERVFQAQLDALRASKTVDYDRVSSIKRKILEACFDTFQEQHLAGPRSGEHDRTPSTDRGRAFVHYVREEGAPLELFAVFQVLTEELRHQHPLTWVWQEWPEQYRHPRSAHVAAFRATHGARIRFYQYLQWLASDQLGAVAKRARELGMPIGLYHDLALGCDRSGSEAWAFQDLLALGADCGAPPDPFSPQGQDWGVPPVNPVRLRANGYQLFIGILRKCLGSGGALRLDHAMGLFRVFWIPRGMPASRGTYVQYPADDLLGILALESVRHRAMIVGEDLGTVPDWVRNRLAAARVLSYRVFYFERTEQQEWKSPADYPEQATAVVSTHDLPTLYGYWTGQDIELRAKLGFFPDDRDRERAREERRREKLCIARALHTEELLPNGLTVESAAAQDMTPDLCCAIHSYLARTPSWVLLANFQDVLGELAPVNVPGTVDSYPNWSLKATLSLEEARGDPRPAQLATALCALRPPKPV